jgi:hypothetical protein
MVAALIISLSAYLAAKGRGALTIQTVSRRVIA